MIYETLRTMLPLATERRTPTHTVMAGDLMVPPWRQNHWWLNNLGLQWLEPCRTNPTRSEVWQDRALGFSAFAMFVTIVITAVLSQSAPSAI